MTWSFRVRYAVVLVALLARPAAGASGPAEAPALNSQLNPAWDRLAQSNDKFLTKDQEALLHDLAFATAAAGGCPGFTIDRDKFKQGFESFKTDDYMKLPAEEKRKFDYRLMMNYGAATRSTRRKASCIPRTGAGSPRRSATPDRAGSGSSPPAPRPRASD